MQWLWIAIVVVAATWYLAQVIRQCAQNITRVVIDPGQGLLSSEYPVFSRRFVLEANQLALQRTRELLRLQGEVRSDVNKAAAARQVTEPLAKRMLEVCEALVLAEECWYRHAVFMDANIGVTCGRVTRDEALAAAEDGLQKIASAMRSYSDAKLLRDEWKARLEKPDSSPPELLPRDAANKWHDWYSQRPDMLK